MLDNDYSNLFNSIWIPSDGGTGKLVDYGINRFHGARTNVVKVPSPYGWAGSFNGSNTYYNCGAVYQIALGTTPLTMMMTFNSTSASGTRVFGTQQTTGNRGCFFVSEGDPSSQVIRWTMYDGSATQSMTSVAGSCPNGVWHTVVVRYPGTNSVTPAHMFLDGKDVTTRPNNAVQSGVTLAGNFGFGARQLEGTPALYYNGKIALGAYSTKALNPNVCRELSANPFLLLDDDDDLFGKVQIGSGNNIRNLNLLGVGI